MCYCLSVSLILTLSVWLTLCGWLCVGVCLSMSVFGMSLIVWRSKWLFFEFFLWVSVIVSEWIILMSCYIEPLIDERPTCLYIRKSDRVQRTFFTNVIFKLPSVRINEAGCCVCWWNVDDLAEWLALDDGWAVSLGELWTSNVVNCYYGIWQLVSWCKSNNMNL